MLIIMRMMEKSSRRNETDIVWQLTPQAIRFQHIFVPKQLTKREISNLKLDNELISQTNKKCLYTLIIS